MNAILKILIILLIGVLIAGAFYLTVENTSLFSNLEGSSHEGGDGFGKGQRPEGARGDHHNEEASLSQGLAQVGGSLLKISGITLVVLAIQFIFARLKKLRMLKASVA